LTLIFWDQQTHSRRGCLWFVLI